MAIYVKNLEIDLYEIPIWGDGKYETSQSI